MNYSLNQQLIAKKGKIAWLSSYPKSGNTWLRAFLTNLLHEEEFDINNMIGDAYFPSKKLFGDIVGIESNFLTPSEIERYRPFYIDYLVQYYQTNRLLFVKIHDRFKNPPNSYIKEKNTASIIYIIRNPLAIVPR